MRKQETVISYTVMGILGFLIVLWFSLKIAPGVDKGLIGVFKVMQTAIADPFNFEIVQKTPATVFVCSAAYLFAAVLYYTMLHRFRHGEEYGSAKWGSVAAISRKYKDQRSEKKAQNLLLTRNVAIATSLDNMYRHQRNLNVIVIGGSGAQKTRSHVMPNLLQAENSFIVLDPSGEILRATGKFLEQSGYKIKVLNLFEPAKSQRYNPFMYLKGNDDVDHMVENFWKATTDPNAVRGEQFWEDSAKMLFYAVSYYLYYFAPLEEQNFPMVHWMVSQMKVDEDKKETSLVDGLFERLEETHPDHIALKFYRAYSSGAGRTLQSVQITLLSRLSKFTQDTIVDLSSTTKDELGLIDVPYKKSVLFAITPVADTTLNFFVTMLYGQLFDILYRYGGENGKLARPLHLLMDEFANITLPRDFDKYLATFRKYSVSASIILQDLSQLKALYEKQWQSIVGNCDSLLYLGGNEETTCKYISESVGKQTIKTNTFGFNRGRNGGSSKNEQQLGRDLITPDEVRALDNNYAVLLIRGEPPVLDKKYDLTKHPNYRMTAFCDNVAPYEAVDRVALQEKQELRYMTAGARIRLDLTEEEIRLLPPLPLPNDPDFDDVEFRLYTPNN